MYVPPPGRPMSCPPMGDTTEPTQPERKRRKRLTPDERAAMAADLAAGMSMVAVREKYGYRGKRGKAEFANARPVRMEGESKQRYGQRVQQWMRETNPEYDAQIRANKSAGQRRLAKKRRLAKLRAQREAEEKAAATRRYYEFVTRAEAVLAPLNPPEPLPAPVVTPPPSFLRRMFWWLLP